MKLETWGMTAWAESKQFSAVKTFKASAPYADIDDALRELIDEKARKYERWITSEDIDYGAPEEL